MEKYQNNVQNRKGDAVVGASVRVVTYPSGVLATIYSDNGATTTANPLTTDSEGVFEFYAADGRYSLEISGKGIPTHTVEDISIAEELPPQIQLDLANTADTLKGDALVGVKQPFTGAVARTQHDKNADSLSLYDMGAIGDGTLHALSERFDSLAAAQVVYPFATALTQSIDWAAAQAYSNTSHGEFNVHVGTFVINDTLTFSSKKSIVGRGGKIKASGMTGNMLSFSANDCSVTGIEIDGSDVSRCALHVDAGGFRAEGNYLHNFSSLTTSTIVVEIETSLGASVIGNRIEYVFSAPNGILGDAPGASRAVQINSSTPATVGSVISDNRIAQVTGEEGDAIQVLFYDGVSTPFLSAKTLVSNNTIVEFSRRGIKIQSNDCSVIGNKLFCANTYTNQSFAINVISASNVVVADNFVQTVSSCFSSSGASGLPNQNVSVTGNSFYISGNTLANSFCDWNTGLCVRDNIFTNGTSGFASQNTNSTDVTNNSFYGGPVGTGQAIQLFGGTTGLNVISNNKSLGNWTRAINFTGISTVVKDNLSSTLGINTVAGNTDAIISGNVSGSGVAITGTTTSQVLFDNQRIAGGVHGNAGLGANRVFHSSANPSTTNPTKNYAQGDFAWYTSPGSNDKLLGWICITSGAPATWREVYTQLFGAGSPEGAVSASVGTIYSRTDGAAGTSVYVKESGTGNTGWRALASSSGVRVVEGANAKQGTATLVAGASVVANTSVTANSRIFLTSNADGGTPGFLRVSARVVGTSFTITSSSGTDTSTVAYEIFEPA